MAFAAARLISRKHMRYRTFTADLILLELFQWILVPAATLRHGLRTIACTAEKAVVHIML